MAVTSTSAVEKTNGDAVGLEQRRHLRLAGDAADALAHVPDQRPAAAGGERRDQRPDAADALDLVAVAADGCLDRVDGFGDVELTRLLVGESLREVVVAQVVGEADAHGYSATSNQGSMP